MWLKFHHKTYAQRDFWFFCMDNETSSQRMTISSQKHLADKENRENLKSK